MTAIGVLERYSGFSDEKEVGGVAGLDQADEQHWELDVGQE